MYQALKGPDTAPFLWEAEQEDAFQIIKTHLGQAPALGLPDPSCPFELYTHEKEKIALGVLTQKVGPWRRPVAYLSKQLDNVAAGWPPCLRAIAAAVILLQEADKLTLGQEINLFVPHAVSNFLAGQGHKWLSNPRLTQYQGILHENPRVKINTVRRMNPATFLPAELGEPDHDCLEGTEEVYSSRPDLQDQPLSQPDLTLYTDGSSYMTDGKRLAGYAVVSDKETLEAKPLPAGWSAQRADCGH